MINLVGLVRNQTYVLSRLIQFPVGTTTQCGKITNTKIIRMIIKTHIILYPATPCSIFIYFCWVVALYIFQSFWSFWFKLPWYRSTIDDRLTSFVSGIRYSFRVRSQNTTRGRSGSLGTKTTVEYSTNSTQEGSCSESDFDFRLHTAHAHSLFTFSQKASFELTRIHLYVKSHS